MKIINIVLLLVAMLTTGYMGYLHGVNVGIVDVIHYLGPVLFQCVNLIGGN